MPGDTEWLQEQNKKRAAARRASGCPKRAPKTTDQSGRKRARVAWNQRRAQLRQEAREACLRARREGQRPSRQRGRSETEVLDAAPVELALGGEGGLQPLCSSSSVYAEPGSPVNRALPEEWEDLFSAMPGPSALAVAEAGLSSGSQPSAPAVEEPIDDSMLNIIDQMLPPRDRFKGPAELEQVRFRALLAHAGVCT